MGKQIQEAVTRYKMISRIEADTERSLSGIKRKIIANLNADQIQEFAAIVYAEDGPLGCDTKVLPAVKR